MGAQIKNLYLPLARDLFFKEFMYSCDIHAALREHQVKSSAVIWIELLKLMHQQDHPHKIAIEAKSRETWDAYKKARNLVNSSTHQVKQDYFRQKITKHFNILEILTTCSSIKKEY